MASRRRTRGRAGRSRGKYGQIKVRVFGGARIVRGPGGKETVVMGSGRRRGRGGRVIESKADYERRFMAPLVKTWEETAAGQKYRMSGVFAKANGAEGVGTKKAKELKAADVALREIQAEWGTKPKPLLSEYQYQEKAYKQLFGAQDAATTARWRAEAQRDAESLARSQFARTWKPKTITKRAPETTFGFPTKAAYLEWRAGKLAEARTGLASWRKSVEAIKVQPRFSRRQMGTGRGSIPARLRLPMKRQERARMVKYRRAERARVKAAESAIGLWETQTQV